MNWINDIYANNPKIEVKFYEGLTVDFCKKENAKYILRGLRDSHDFKFEKGIAQMNNNLNSEVSNFRKIDYKSYLPLEPLHGL